MENQLYKDHWFKRTVEIQISPNAFRNQYQETEYGKMQLKNLRKLYIGYRATIEQALRVNSSAEFKNHLDMLTTSIEQEAHGGFTWGSIRKGLNLIFFMLAANNAYVTNENYRIQLLGYLEVPVDNHVVNLLKKKYPKEQSIKEPFTIVGLSEERHTKIQNLIKRYRQENPEECPAPYYFDFLAWRVEEQEYQA